VLPVIRTLYFSSSARAAGLRTAGVDGQGFRGQAVVDVDPEPRLWNGVLYMLGLLHVSGNFHLYY
jgi:hypothetical protein